MLFVAGVVVRGLTAAQWWRDIRREAAYQGSHTHSVQWNMRWGIVLFIAREVLFFFSFFWAYFNRSLSPGLECGFNWPPTGLTPFNPFGIPLLNTTILLTSGLTVTWAHHALMAGQHTEGVIGLLRTIVLGAYFTFVQGYEYLDSRFTFADAVYGSCFFMATGFHGLHVLIGSLFLTVVWSRLIRGQLRLNHHFGFEAAAWYWHFVDVVWVFLFMAIYWWGRFRSWRSLIPIMVLRGYIMWFIL